MMRSNAGACWILAILFTSAVANGYERTGFKWNQAVPYEVNSSSSRELGRETTLSVVADSYAAWQDPSCSDFQYVYRGETQGDYRTGDQVNTLVWRYDGNRFPRELGGASTIGVTLSSAYGRQAIDGDIVFNGIDHRWVVGAGRYGEVDAQSIITHEIGHQLGLDHSPYQDATMYAAYLGGNGARSLSNDDIAGVCNLYPSGQSVECERNGDCASGEICSGGRCVAGSASEPGGIGAACGQTQPCETGMFCVMDQRGNAFCTRECGGGCPVGWSCERVNFGSQIASICLENENDPVGTGQLGDPCNGGYNCASGFCVSDGRDAFCTQSCRNDDDCPAGAECYPLNEGGGACVPGQETADPQAPNSPSPTDLGTGASIDMGTSGGMSGSFVDEFPPTFPDSEASAQAGCDECDQSSGRPLGSLVLLGIVIFGFGRRKRLLPRRPS